MLLGVGLALLTGMALGLFGGGGSILTVPIFVYILGFGAKESIAMSLAVVGVTSLAGAGRHWRAGNVDVRLALAFGGVAMAGTYLGARLSALVSGGFQLLLFGAVMLAAAMAMLRHPTLTPGRRHSLAGIVAQGLAVGVLTGMVGVGGGFLIVPALVLLGGVPIRTAIGTSLLIITLNATTGFIGYLGQVDVAWTTIAWFSVVSSAGIFIGSHIVNTVPQRALRRAFAVFLLVMGVGIVYANRSVVTGGWTDGGKTARLDRRYRSVMTMDVRNGLPGSPVSRSSAQTHGE